MPTFPAPFTAWGWREEFFSNPALSASHTGIWLVHDLSNMSATFWANVGIDGDDIRVTLDNGTTEVDYKLVGFDGPSEVGQLWIKVDTTVSANYFGWIYYDNPAAPPASTSAAFSDASLFMTFDDGTNDQSPNGNNGTLNGSAAIIGGGLNGDAVNMPGVSNNAVLVNDSPELDPAGDKFTAGAWVKFNTTMGSNVFNAIFFKGLYTVAGGEWLFVHRDSGTFKGMYVQFRDGGANQKVICTVDQAPTIENGSWHYCTFTHDPAASPTTKLYLDAVVVGSGNIDRNINGAKDLRIGNHDALSLPGRDRDFDNVFIKKGFAESIEWMADTEANQSDPNVFWEYGDPEENEVCELNIISAIPSSCIGGIGSNFSLTVNLNYTYPPASGTLDIIIDGTTYSNPITGSPQVVLISGLVCGDSDLSPVEAEFSADTGCSDSKTYTVPAPLPCTISIGAIAAPTCSGATYDVTIPLTYTNPPVGGQIRLTLDGTDVYYSAITGSPQNVIIMGRTCGEGSVSVLAEFVEDAGCSDTDSYTAPIPVCSVQIDSLTPGICLGSTYSLEVVTSYVNEPVSGFLLIEVVGEYGPTAHPITGSPQTDIITGLPCNGAIENVNVVFSANPLCQNTDSYTAPDNAAPQEQLRILVDGTNYTDDITAKELKISLQFEDYEYFFEYPNSVDVTGALYAYLRGLGVCERPEFTIEYKCFGGLIWKELAFVEMDLLGASWDLCRCAGKIPLVDVSDSANLRSNQGDGIDITPDTDLTGVDETETNCTIIGFTGNALEPKGMRLFDLMQEVIDEVVGAGKITLVSDFLTTDYTPEIQTVTFTDLYASDDNLRLETSPVYSGEEIQAEASRAGRTPATRQAAVGQMKELEAAYGFMKNSDDYDQDVITGASYVSYAPSETDNEKILTVVNPLPATVKGFVGATQYNGVITTPFQQGAGNLYVTQGLSGGDIKTSWGELTELVKRVYGCGIYYKRDEIIIEPLSDLYMSVPGNPPTSAPTPATPIAVTGDHFAEEEPNTDMMARRFLLGQDSFISEDKEAASNANFDFCTPDTFDINVSTVTTPVILSLPKYGKLTFGGDLEIENQTGFAVTTDVVLYIDSLSKVVMASGLNVPAMTTVPVDVSAMSAFVGTGNTFEIRLDNATDPIALFDATTAAEASYTITCPVHPLVSDARRLNTDKDGYFLNKDFEDCRAGEIDFRLDDTFYIGAGRMVSEAAQQGNVTSAKFLFHVSPGDAIRQFPYKGYFNGLATALPDNCSNISNIHNAFLMYGTPLSRHHIFFYLTNAHRLYLEKWYTRFEKEWILILSTFNETQTPVMKASNTFPNRVAMGPYRSRVLKIRTGLETDTFLDIADTLRITSDVCGTTESGEIKRVVFDVVTKETEIEFLA